MITYLYHIDEDTNHTKWNLPSFSWEEVQDKVQKKNLPITSTIELKRLASVQSALTNLKQLGRVNIYKRQITLTGKGLIKPVTGDTFDAVLKHMEEFVDNISMPSAEKRILLLSGLLQDMQSLVLSNYLFLYKGEIYTAYEFLCKHFFRGSGNSKKIFLEELELQYKVLQIFKVTYG